MNRKLRFGMIGGGAGSFIGSVHRSASQFFGEAELVAGAFSRDPDNSRNTGDKLYLDPTRVYADWQLMIRRESQLPPDQRLDFISIVTQNDMHFPIASAALQAGFHVLCEKPLAMNLEQATQLRQIVKQSGKLFGLMHNYTGYPMIRQAKAMIARGDLGNIRKVVVEYSLGWLAAPNACKQAVWRNDPKQAGACGCMGDIGTHAQNLISFLTGLRMTQLCADLTTFVDGCVLDDDGSVLVHFDNGARGLIFCSEVAVGQENNFRLCISGDQGALEWEQEKPENLVFRKNDEPIRTFRRGWAGTLPEAQAATHLPAGHPEGFFEAFANVYANFIACVRARQQGDLSVPADFPGIQDGVEEMVFLETLLQSQKNPLKWTPVPTA